MRGRVSIMVAFRRKADSGIVHLRYLRASSMLVAHGDAHMPRLVMPFWQHH